MVLAIFEMSIRQFKAYVTCDPSDLYLNSSFTVQASVETTESSNYERKNVSLAAIYMCSVCKIQDLVVYMCQLHKI